MKKIWLLACLLVVSAPDIGFAESPKPLTLDQALDMAYRHSPLIKGSEADYKAAQGERSQASAFPNPVLVLDAENIAGSGPYNGSDNAELTAGVSQLVEIGGKRSARKAIADRSQTIALYGQSTAKFDLTRNVTQAFANAVAAQEQAVVAQEQVKLAKDVYATVNKRVSAAAEPIVQRNKAKILLTNAELSAERAAGRKKATLKMLTSIWGDTANAETLSTEWFYKTEKPSPDTDIRKLLQNSVDYRRQTANVEQTSSLLDLEKANSVPDPSFNVAVRELRSTNDQALVLGVSLPLPVFNRNSGNIEKVRQQAIKADTERQRLLFDGQARLADLAQQLDNAWLSATKIKKDILPEAQEAFAQARRGYNAGRFAYLEVLDAQRTLVDTRISYIQALQDYHIAKSDIERLTAQDTATGDKK